MIWIIISTLLLVFMLLYYFFPSFHYEKHEGVEYYIDASYSKMGFGFNRYGKIASKYLPAYDDVAENATFLNFIYHDGGMLLYKTVEIQVGARYDEATYISKRDEILKMGTDFGTDHMLINSNLRYYRLIDKKYRMNGEYVYYVISCCDRDNAITYMVLFDIHNYDRILFWDDQTMVFSEFWDELHVTCKKDMSE